ncbi:MAG: mevalonate kinase [Crocinitomicaceae bacterium]|nr:mevalonate kinase [Crocinitomicaceae bacterium]|tara:strand:+ start:3095 stop:4033 length:939 start_codon:yes stop_codon:yes gene_type:complete
MLKDSKYYSKILLFGEYGIIKDSMGLSIPYNDYNGSLIFSAKKTSFSRKSNQNLNKFYNHLSTLEGSNKLPCKLDLNQFKLDIEKGIFFDSSIPQGFGVGSSGALVAAVYDTYCTNKIVSSSDIPNKSILKLKNIFGQLESFFHGTSSGLDPLICYLNLPILIKSKENLGTVGIPSTVNGKGAIFLMNTGETGETQPLVQHFLERCKEDGFRKMLKNKFKKYNDASIEAFLKNDIKPLLKNVKNLSKVILENFKPMIPKLYHKLWQEGIESNAYYLKLCGSGGGGFILGFTEDFEKAQQKLQGYSLDVIHRF